MNKFFTSMLLFLICISYACCACVNPDEVYYVDSDTVFCPGNFSMQHPIRINASEIELKCNSTILLTAHSSNSLEAVNALGISISGCMIDGGNIGVALMGVKDSSFYDNVIAGSAVPYYVRDSSDNQFISNDMYGNEDGLNIIDSDGNNFYDNFFNNTAKFRNLLIVNSSSNIFLNNTFEGSTVQVIGDNENTFCTNDSNNQFINAIVPEYASCNPEIFPEEGYGTKQDNLSSTYSDDLYNNETSTTSDEENTDKYTVKTPQLIPMDNPFSPEASVDVLKHYYAYLSLDKDEKDKRLMKDSSGMAELAKKSTIQKKVLIYDDHSTMVIDIVLPEEHDIVVFESIPKTYARSSDQIISIPDHEVIVDDPLLAWHFENVDKISVNYTVNSTNVSSTQTMLFAQDYDTKSRFSGIIFPVLLVPLITIGVVYFSKFRKYD